jgi:CPA1 family monovalent cation:H+ antiporter
MGFVAITSLHTSLPVAGFVWLVLLAALTTVIARRVRVPYTVALVLVGLLVSALGLLSDVQPTADVILVVFLPPLLFEAALQTDIRAFGRTLPVVLLLAVPGVILSTVLVGLAVAWLTPLAIWPALLFGALIAATDPVSVVATFRQLGAPLDLTTMVEGESLFNDGTALVLSAVLLTAATTGHFDTGTAIVSFLWAIAGAVLTGGIAAFALSQATRLIDDPAVETTLSTVLAYGSYLIADQLGASGAVAVVVAGLIYGSYGQRIGLSAESKHLLEVFWSYIGFLANAVLFVLIGLEIHLDALGGRVGWIAVAVAAVLLSRALLVYALTPAMHRITWAYGHVLFWGGIRGGVALAIAISLRSAVPGRALIQALTFGVVLFTILVQGLTIDPLVERLGLVSSPAGEETRAG